MKISTKGRYALRVMVDLATTDPQNYISIKSISKRLNISDKYLEQIISSLSKAGYVKSTRGAQGGYMLTRTPEEYTVGMILRSMEGSLAPVACLEDDENQCPHCSDCISLYVWEQIYDAVNNVVNSITLQNIIDKMENENASPQQTNSDRNTGC